MKNVTIIIVLIVQVTFSQVIDPAYAPIKADTNVIIYKVAELENYLNNASEYNYEQSVTFLDEAYFIELKNSKDLIDRTIENSKLSIQVNKIEINDNSSVNTSANEVKE